MPFSPRVFRFFQNFALSLGVIALGAIALHRPSFAQSQPCSSGLPASLQHYLRLYQDFQQNKPGAYEAAKYEAANTIVEKIIQEKNITAYRQCLAQIDRLSTSAPQAIADLAYALQLAWESRYLLLALEESRSKNKWMNTSAQISTQSASLLFPLYAIRGASEFVPGYFKLFAKTAFVAAPLAHTYFATRDSSYPPAPAQLLSLGSRIKQDDRQEALFDQSMRQARSDLAGATAGMMAFYYAGRTLMYTGEAGTFLATKPSPWSIAAGISLAILADAAVTDAANALEDYRYNIQLKARLITAEKAFLRESACTFGNSESLIRTTIELMGAALKTESYIHLDFLEKQAKYEQELAERPQDTEWLRQERHRELRQMVLQRRYGADPFYMRREARDLLQQAGIVGAQKQLEFLPGPLQSALQGLISEYQGARQQKRNLTLRQFIHENQSKDQQFLIHRFHNRLTAGGPMIVPQPDALLMETAALIEQTGSRFLKTYSDQILIDRVRKYAALFEAAMRP